ncbi:hypothetical protein H0266_10630 [Halobacillus locisalis]|uniref:Uncharacterized protein n=1 Tax=Halobacillus locisalis TaxID=220753 RepID=A0A838CT86_9BACI|nr:hypothetical protein [Halobacillus locisalis]MBA2175352.1 hypothetical protein [Halobacillus locisalis]
MNELPKSVTKTIRYIKYQAPEDKLIQLEKEINQAIRRRRLGKEREVHDRRL